MCVLCVCVHSTKYIWSSEGNFQKLLLSFYHKGSKNGTQVVRVGNKYLYPLSYLVNSYLFFLNNYMQLQK